MSFPTRLMDESEALAIATSGHFVCTVAYADPAYLLGIGHDWDNPGDVGHGRCYVYKLQEPQQQNDWLPIAGPFHDQPGAQAWINRLLPRALL